MLNTYKIPDANLATLQHRFAKLVRRCTRAKIEAPVLTVTGFEDIPYKNEDGFDRVRRVHTVTVESNGRPRINGFEFAAVIAPQTTEDGEFLGNVIRRVPGFEQELPQRFRQVSNLCEHCNTSRRRNETFVIANEAGFKQVGRQCLANYLGLTNPETLAELAQILIDANDLGEMSERDGFGSGAVAERVPVDDVLMFAASAIRQYGWLSRKSAMDFNKTSTADRVSDWVFGGPKTRENFEHPLIVTDEDKALATETENWLETLSDRTSEYEQNLSLLARATSITGKNFGIVVSAINAYSREKERAIRRNARIESDVKSEFVGTVGERITIENATVLYCTTFHTHFGVTNFYKFAVADNILVYFASSPMGFQQGEVIPSMTARVKNHENRVDDYNPQGVKQTVITRATLPKPPKAPLTPEQKKLKKAIAKLRKVQRTLPNNGQLANERREDGTAWEYSDFVAWDTVTNLMWELQREVNG